MINKILVIKKKVNIKESSELLESQGGSMYSFLRTVSWGLGQRLQQYVRPSV